MNLLQALKEIKAKSKNTDNIKRFMVVRRKYEDSKPIIVARICIRDSNIPLSNIDVSMDDLVASDWEILTAYKQDNPGINIADDSKVYCLSYETRYLNKNTKCG